MGNDGLTVKKKKGQKRCHITDEERGEIKALLKLKIYTCLEIGEMVGRSCDAVEKIAHKYNIPLLGQSKRSEEYKMRLAQMFGDLSERMLGSLAKESESALGKASIAQRAMVAGIAADKLCVLSKTKEEEQAQNVTLSWVQLVQQTTPGRSKDGHGPAPVQIDVEEAEVVTPAKTEHG